MCLHKVIKDDSPELLEFFLKSMRFKDRKQFFRVLSSLITLNKLKEKESAIIKKDFGFVIIESLMKDSADFNSIDEGERASVLIQYITPLFNVAIEGKVFNDAIHIGFYDLFILREDEIYPFLTNVKANSILKNEIKRTHNPCEFKKSFLEKNDLLPLYINHKEKELFRMNGLIKL